MNKILVTYDFTIAKPKSRFVGKSGECEFTIEGNVEDVNPEDEQLIRAIAQEILKLKPNWKIFFIQVKSITKIELEHSK